MCNLIIAKIKCRNDFDCLFTTTLRGDILCDMYANKVHKINYFQNVVILPTRSMLITNLTGKFSLRQI